MRPEKRRSRDKTAAMKLYEYQAKELFRKYRIPAPEGAVAFSPEQAAALFRRFNRKVAIKAQVHAGGRGKAGGVKLAESEEQVKTLSRQILAMEIKGLPVGCVLVEEAINIDRELYMSLVVDRAGKSAVLILSAAGGMDIEETAKKTPEKILKTALDPFVGLKSYHLRSFNRMLNLPPETEKALVQVAQNLYRLFTERDATLCEINPLVITREGKVLAADGKVDIDDNADFRQAEVTAFLKEEMERSVEHQAKEKGLSYVKLDGTIGCVVNGAGLSMATMDVIKLFNGAPANFLDIGGSSNPEKVRHAMALLMNDKNVKVALFNIFGGITRCDDVARGMMAAIRDLKPGFPMVVRLTGTNAEAARELLKGSKLIFSESMVDAAKKAVEMAKP